MSSTYFSRPGNDFIFAQALTKISKWNENFNNENTIETLPRDDTEIELHKKKRSIELIDRFKK